MTDPSQTRVSIPGGSLDEMQIISGQNCHLRKPNNVEYSSPQAFQPSGFELLAKFNSAGLSWALGCVNSPIFARGSQEAVFTQPRVHSLAHPCT